MKSYTRFFSLNNQISMDGAAANKGVLVLRGSKLMEQQLSSTKAHNKRAITVFITDEKNTENY